MNLRTLIPPSRASFESDEWPKFLEAWAASHKGRPVTAKELLHVAEALGLFKRFLRTSKGRHRARRMALLVREAHLSLENSPISCQQRAGYSGIFRLKNLIDDSPAKPLVGFQKQVRIELPPIICACGCAQVLPPVRLDNRVRRYIRGHNRRRVA